MRFLSILGEELEWQLREEILLALLMAYHSRLGRQCVIRNLNIDIFLTMLWRNPRNKTNREKRARNRTQQILNKIPITLGF